MTGWEQDLLDAIDVQIAGSLTEMARDVESKYHAAGKPKAVQAYASEIRSFYEQRLIALERWYQSNKPQSRHLPHVFLQRTRLVDRDLDQLLLTP